MSLCLTPGEAIRDHLVKTVTTRLVLCEVTIFLPVINKDLVGRYFEIAQVSCF